jgi:hypothetical protein
MHSSDYITAEECEACWYGVRGCKYLRKDTYRAAEECLHEHRQNCQRLRSGSVLMSLEATFDMLQELIEEAKETSISVSGSEMKSLMEFESLYETIASYPNDHAQGLIRWCRKNDGRRGIEKHLLGASSFQEFSVGSTNWISSRNREIRSHILDVATDPATTPDSLAAAARIQSLHSRLFARLMGFADEEAVRR